jgi:hypothetical protein
MLAALPNIQQLLKIGLAADQARVYHLKNNLDPLQEAGLLRHV